MSTYVMRWNPAISSSRIADYNQARALYPDGFMCNWSIYDWQEAKQGDKYIMIRVGAGTNGVVYHGVFLSDPYEGSDWAGTSTPRHYVDISIEHPCHPDEPCITIEELEAAIPEVVWRRGHSGEKLTAEQAQIIEALLYTKLYAPPLA